MFKKATPFFIRAITPVHAGSGNDLGVVDLPIQREKHTGFPKIEGSTLKGSIRDFFEIQISNNGNEKIKKEIKLHLIFGYDKDNASKDVEKFFEEEIDFTQFSSAIAFADARILLFPIKSLKGVFAYITSPAVLKRFKEDLNMAQKEFDLDIESVEENSSLVSKNSKLLVQGDKVVLEEYMFKVEKDDKVDKVDKLAESLAKLLPDIDENFLKERLIILNDNDFTDFVKLSTEVITRIKIDNETGTVKSGALFTEEYLPTEAIMYSIAFFSPLFVPEDIKSQIKKKLNNSFDFLENTPKEFFEKIDNQTLQIGGNETIGKGFIKVKLYENGGSQ